MGSPQVNKNPKGLPVSNPSLSFWQQTTRSFPYLNANKTEPVPEKCSYVIIGSGIVSRPPAVEPEESHALARSDLS